MTIEEYDSYILNVGYIFGQEVHRFTGFIRMGKELGTLRDAQAKLFLMKSYLNLLLEFDLEEGDDNFLTIDQMLHIAFKLNELQKTNFAPDFVFEPTIP